MRLAAFDQARHSWWERLPIVGIWLAALLIAVHPIAVDDLWWELSKGRAVANGSWHPTADLITGSTGADADWLSGVIPYCLVTMFGMSGLMSLKIVVGVVMTRLLLRRTSDLESGVSWAMSGIALLAFFVVVRQSGEPGPHLGDLFGFVAVFLATEKLTANRNRGQLGVVLLLLTLWANLGPRVVVGLLVAGSKMLPRPARLAPCLGLSVAMLTCICLTPAGWMTPRNSLIQTWPALADRMAVLQVAGWHPWWSHQWAAESIAFLLLSAIYLLATSSHPSWQRLFVFLTAQMLACFSAENLPLASLWLILTATESSEVQAATSGISGSPFRAVSRRIDASAVAVKEPGRLGWQTAGYWGVFVWVIWVASHPWSGSESGLGWGVDPRLNSEAFSASLVGTSVVGNAHCAGVREAGLLSWHAPTGVRPFDTPVSALMNHRLREHVLLTSDFSQRWQTPHRRSDGTWGGWWQTTRSRDITLLVVPAENLEMIAALEPTIWKPFSLNAVSLVYGKAGDPRGAQQIVKTLSLRQIVDRGAWTYQATNESSSDLIEFFAWPGKSAVARQSLRLARVFRAMEMHFAALKILHAIPGRNRKEVRDEFVANQLALGYGERIIGGRSSEFRLRTCLLDDQFTRSDIRDRLNWPQDAVLTDNDPLAASTLLYASGDLARALDRLSSGRQEELYAKAQLLLEAGEPGQARHVLQELIKQGSDRPLAILALRLFTILSE